MNRLEFNGKVNQALEKLINDYYMGRVKMFQIRKFVAKNEIALSKLVGFMANDSAKNCKAKSKPSKPTIMAGKKKTPDQRNSLGFRVTQR